VSGTDGADDEGGDEVTAVRRPVSEELVPIFRSRDARAAAAWYARLGFEQIGEHQFGPHLPRYVFLRRGDVHLHVSEHAGDAPFHSVAYLYADDVDTVAAEFGVEAEEQPWGMREITLVDPDGNRVRVGTHVR
jgi:catechol 2,3-dioxygenase-like lactoylglutathione lyase family enzyme